MGFRKEETQPMNMRLMKNGHFVGILRYMPLSADTNLFLDLEFFRV